MPDFPIAHHQWSLIKISEMQQTFPAYAMEGQETCGPSQLHGQLKVGQCGATLLAKLLGFLRSGLDRCQNFTFLGASAVSGAAAVFLLVSVVMSH